MRREALPTAAVATHHGQTPTRLAALVDCIELELRRIGYWERDAPSSRALASEMPFCVDTLSITQWLQWIFVPRMRRLLRNGEPLPTACDILPLARECLEGRQREAAQLFDLIGSVDRLLSERGRALH